VLQAMIPSTRWSPSGGEEGGGGGTLRVHGEFCFGLENSVLILIMNAALSELLNAMHRYR
jgi:hypothetical protein